MGEIENTKVAAVFEQYPINIQKKLFFLRQLILDTASETDGVDSVEETLKWGEPSYVTKTGSTLRMGWKKSNPSQYALYFNCNTKLVETFREFYRDTFIFEGNRAIVFKEDDDIFVDELKQCIASSLTYHTRKHLPMLGL
ncbi:hypothetical protein PAECIP111893_01513 [Paenibacillus plantiphilus]|uniref:YdhG-like domain-containing protein n=1 Tax=Paenibacillus plantiphilus TaxID=2905650 RepID=A0ABN8G9Z6_9BACL|nr:DUF1801 domain-containing protein [Paenibacillus plantiphilus]CAH1200630.1 hypothetical protein PAECIP111893_01513 [Paenibacillus plantiphilus]